ncbi:hypothetical protein K3495_g14391 [Podosphaera aphanis]|nr:hypothetical protein K3495_g14391 [Podosphaera aphanis]
MIAIISTSHARTLWYTICETKNIAWAKRGGALPETPRWDEWLRLAEEKALAGSIEWPAVQNRQRIVCDETPPKNEMQSSIPATETLPSEKTRVKSGENLFSHFSPSPRRSSPSRERSVGQEEIWNVLSLRFIRAFSHESPAYKDPEDD